MAMLFHDNLFVLYYQQHSSQMQLTKKCIVLQSARDIYWIRKAGSSPRQPILVCKLDELPLMVMFFLGESALFNTIDSKFNSITLPSFALSTNFWTATAEESLTTIGLFTKTPPFKAALVLPNSHTKTQISHLLNLHTCTLAATC